MALKSKELGQVFTPDFIVKMMSENLDILNKKILEPSCGEGAFLKEIARKYIGESLQQKASLKAIREQLEANLIGIEIDANLLKKCKENLDLIAGEFGLKNVKWNLINGDFLELYKDFLGKIDIVIGNPPYIRIHNLDKNARKFLSGSMGDLFLIFFELGFLCLKNGGELIFITPSSWLNSKAALALREGIYKRRDLVKLIDFAHEKIFKNITTYSLISFFRKNHRQDFIAFYDFKNDRLKRVIKYDDLFLDKHKFEIYLGDKRFKEILRLKPLPVKNGFATLCDEFFIGDFDGLNYPKIKALKASNGKFYDCIFPYDENGNFISPKGAVLRRYKDFSTQLKKRDLRGANWQEFGRSQAIKDVKMRKIAFNTMIKELKDLRICEVEAKSGVFSGLYLVSKMPLNVFERALRNDEFLDFVKSLRKYKNGGYYSFNGADLGRFLANALKVI